MHVNVVHDQSTSALANMATQYVVEWTNTKYGRQAEVKFLV